MNCTLLQNFSHEGPILIWLYFVFRLIVFRIRITIHKCISSRYNRYNWLVSFCMILFYISCWHFTSLDPLWNRGKYWKLLWIVMSWWKLPDYHTLQYGAWKISSNFLLDANYLRAGSAGWLMKLWNGSDPERLLNLVCQICYLSVTNASLQVLTSLDEDNDLVVLWLCSQRSVNTRYTDSQL